jgi:molecular chaperone GrpE
MEHPGQQTEQEEAAPETAASPPTDGAAEAAPEAAVELDLEELQTKARERDEFLALAQRTQADFENFRKRMARDVGAAEQRGVSKVVRELLPALDNLERALGAAEAPPGESEHHLAEGIRLVQAELSAAIARIGVEAYAPAGEQFDPTVHEAVAQHPVEGAASGTVVEVLQKGYRTGDSIIRPARVIVAA